MEPIILTEFVPKTAELTEEEYRILLTEFKSRITVYRSEEHGKFDLYPQQYVGTIVLPVHSLVIQPKIPMLNFFYMLVFSYEIPEFGKQLFGFKQEQTIYEIIVLKFVQEIEKLVKMGLYRDYLTSEENLQTVRGRVSIIENERLNTVQRQRVFCRFNEFTGDILENRILKYALRRLSCLSFGDISLKIRINKLLHHLDPVSYEIIRDSDFEIVERRYTRLNEHYKPLVRISRILIENTSFNLQTQGKMRFWSFLVDMNKLFQKFLTFCLRGLHGFDINPTPTYKWDVEGLTTISPDIVIGKDKKLKLVVDAKYKQIDLEKKKVYGDDVRQVGDYCTTLGLENGILVYPKLSPNQNVHDLLIRKRDPITNRSYSVFLRTINLFPTDLEEFKSACNQFLRYTYLFLEKQD